MDYQVNYGSRAFCVPAAVADHFLRLADENQLRVLLYLLRNESATLPQAAAFLQIGEEQAEEALQFWVQAGVIGTGAQSGFAFTAPEQPAAQPLETVRSSREIKLDPSEIAHELEHSQQLTDLFTLAERLFGRPLTHMEQRSLLWLQAYQGMPIEVILTLLGYCKAIDKCSMSYAESIAISWISADIMTLEQAEAEVRRLTQAHSFTGQIRRLFQMNRRPTAKQQAYIDKWQSAGYSEPLLRYAYELTIEAIDKCNFKYIDAILTDWAAKGITTPEQAQARRSAGKSGGRQPQMSQREREKMDDYLSLVNNFGEE